MARPVDWLGAFLEHEIRQVLAWKEGSAHVKPDPDCRFEDDHSNFRSVADSSLLPSDARVQITKILRTEGDVTAFVTDGFTRVKARLRGNVVAVLETELEGSIDTQTSGDVFEIRKLTVESTPIGLADSFVQLAIEEIEYLFHLRKPLGQASPVEERPEIIRLIGEITKLRQKQYATSRGSSPSASTPSRIRGAIRQGDQAEQSRTDGNIQIQSPRISSPPASSPTLLSSPITQRLLATQVPAKRKRTAPNLESDGYEVQTGINLSRPVQPTRRESFGSRDRAQVAAAHGTDGLFSLLGKPKVKIEPPSEPVEPTAIETQLPLSEARSAPQQHQPEDLVPQSPVQTVPTPIVQVSEPRRAPTPDKRPLVDYARHQIPLDQQKLLDKPSAWRPSLPGQQFPRPNVPVELLRKWNELADSASVPEHAPSSTTSSELPEAATVEPPRDEHIILSTDPSESESSEAEEFGPSQWSPSPPPPRGRQPELPPDSTITSSAKNSTPQHQHRGPPSSFQAQLPRRPSQEYSRFPAQHSSTPGPRSPNPLPRRPDWIPQSTRPPYSAERQTTSFMRPDPRPIIRPNPYDNYYRPPSSTQNRYRPPYPNQHHYNPPSSNRNQGSRPSSSTNRHAPPSSTLVRATQFSPRDSNDLEMAVPRSLERDPSVRYREQRSEHFRGVQRRNWIKEHHHLHHTTSTSPPPSFAQLFSAYKKENPNDKIRLSEFAEELEAVRLDEGKSGDSASPDATPPPFVFPESSTRPVPDSVPPPRPPLSASLPRLPIPSPVPLNAVAASPSIRAEQPTRVAERENHVSEHRAHPANHPQAISIFAEFARAYTDIQPRGSFAAKGTNRKKSMAAPRINVLGWSL